MKILDTRVYRGPNLYALRKVIRLRVDLGELEDYPTNRLPGFVDRAAGGDPDAAGAPLLLRRARRVRAPHDARTRGPGWATSWSTSPSSSSASPARR